MRYLISFYTDAFKIAFDSILAHKLRALLTLIGVVIGVAAVVVVSASVNGLNSYVTQKIGKILGSNHFMIARMAFSGQMDDDAYEKANRRNKKVIWDEYEYIKATCGNCSDVGAQTQSGANLSQEGIEMPSVRMIGVTASMETIEEKTIIEGRFITDDEVQRSAKVCVIGWDVKEKYFGDRSALGHKIKVNGIPLEVVGVEDQRGSFFGDALDRHMYIPVTLHLQMFGWGQGLQLHGKSAEREKLAGAIDEARLDMRNKRKLIGSEEDTFGLVNTADLGNQIDQFTNSIQAVVLPITMITLIVGGIVVMNIMLVSVTERTFEVGLRKALGATQKQIILQFLIESILLCAVGGMLGILLAFGVTQLITVMAQITMNITPFYIFIALGVSSTIGVVAGIYPAYKAAKLDPIVALTTAK
ncbi:MAG TPA: ABC transporter permease [Pyrinomonadaceae bacterium]|jgi:putative ABC transport system permease protein|nr:ABC transporter permease [Pyrinomonadaceae bacterium]